jgi:hypothetical protein
MDKAYGAYGEEEKRIRSLGVENWKKQKHKENAQDLGVNGRM